MSGISRSLLALLLFLLASVSLAQPAEPHRVGGNVKRPEKISGPAPEYTAEAREARVSGVIVLEAIIDELGNVTDVKVLKGLPAGLDQAAISAVESWKFKPATLDGRPVPVYYTLTVNFALETELSFGPRFSQFLEENPELGRHVRARRHGEALVFLKGLDDAGPEVHLARVYVLLALRRFDEAWEEARAYDGPEPYEAFHQVAFAAASAAFGFQEKDRAGVLEIGLQAVDRALADRKHDRQATITKSRLLREKAQLAADPERAALLHEAGELARQAGISP